LIQNGNLYKEKNGLEIEKPEVFFLLNGFKHGKEVIRILDYKQLLQKNFVLLSMDFYYPEKTDRFNVALNIGKIGLYVEKNMQLINALIKRLDYFDFIKHDEITFMGASLGAFVGLAPCAENSEKIKRIILAYAGSDLPLIVETKIPENLKKAGVSNLVKIFAEKKFSFADPSNFINKFTNKPVLIINGTDDATIPHEAALKLQNSFEGKDLSVVTIDGKHIGIHRNDLIEETITHVTDWIKKER
jgi:predicted esterase